MSRKRRRRIIRKSLQKGKKTKIKKPFLEQHNIKRADIFWFIEIAAIILFVVLEAIMVIQGHIMIMQGGGY